jgi:hypothetical protein
VVVRAEQPQPDLVANGKRQRTVVAATSRRDVEVLLIVLYAAYVLAVGATIVVVLRWGF